MGVKPVLFAAVVFFADILEYTGSASACQICFSGLVVTVGQRLDAADRAVLAAPAADGSGLRILAVVKGDIDGDLPDSVSGTETAGAGDRPFLLVRNRLGQQWMNIGTIEAEHVDWLRRLVATRHDDASPHLRIAWSRSAGTISELTDAEWRDRVSVVAPYLENPDPLAADIAHGEISRAPYSAMRSLRHKLDATVIAQWIDEPKLAARRSTYLLLLGIVGGSHEAANLQSRIDEKWRARDAMDLAAMLAAMLELRGPQSVEWIENKYLVDRSRTLPEIEAALLALSVHGETDAAVPRARVIAAYRLFMRERKPMAGFVAQELADWEHWDASADYVALLQSDLVKDPAAHFMIVNYLRRSPREVAKAMFRTKADQ